MAWIEKIILGGPSQHTAQDMAVAYNNLALLAVHLRQQCLAERACYKQIDVLCDRFAAEGDEAIPKMIIQPIINLMRLGFRTAPHEETGAHGRFGSSDWLPDNCMLRDGFFWQVLCKSVLGEQAAAVIDYAVAREVAGIAVTKGNWDKPSSVFMKMRMKETLPSAGSIAVIREAEFVLGDRSDEIARNLHPLVACPYLVEEADESVIELAIQFIQCLLKAPQCSRSNCEIAAATLENLLVKFQYRDSDLGAAIANYAALIKDEWLYAKCIHLFMEPNTIFAPSIYLPDTENSDLLRFAQARIEALLDGS